MTDSSSGEICAKAQKQIYIQSRICMDMYEYVCMYVCLFVWMYVLPCVCSLHESFTATKLKKCYQNMISFFKLRYPKLNLE